MWIKGHYHQNTFTVLEFFKFSIFDKKHFKQNNIGKILNGRAGLELMTNRFVSNAQTYCAWLLGKNI